MQNVRVSSGDSVSVLQFVPPHSSFEIALLNAEVGFVSALKAPPSGGGPPPLEIDAQDLSSHLQARFSGQVLTANQEVTFEYQVGQARRQRDGVARCLARNCVGRWFLLQPAPYSAARPCL
jgi:hypothetical protein